MTGTALTPYSRTRTLLVPISHVPSPVLMEVKSELKRLRQTGHKLKAIQPTAIDNLCSLFRRIFCFYDRLHIVRKSEFKAKEHWRQCKTEESLISRQWLTVCAQAVLPKNLV